MKNVNGLGLLPNPILKLLVNCVWKQSIYSSTKACTFEVESY